MSRAVHRTRSQRAGRSCSLCGVYAMNRRLFKLVDGRIVCVDIDRCARRLELSEG